MKLIKGDLIQDRLAEDERSILLIIRIDPDQVIVLDSRRPLKYDVLSIGTKYKFINNKGEQMEKNLVECKVCRKVKTRVAVGKFGDNKTNIYTDENSVRWNGRVCPQCHKENMKLKTKELRELKKQVSDVPKA